MDSESGLSQASLHSTSRVAGPSQCPGIHEVHRAAVSRSRAGVSPSKVMVIAMGSISAAVAITERDGTRIPSPDHRQPPKERCDGKNVYNFLSR